MFERYAIYFTAQGPLAAAGAAWLGWDVASGRAVAHPSGVGADLESLTETPRKYGFHGTLKPPMVLRAGTDADALLVAFETFCKDTPSAASEGLEITRLGRFLALTPVGDVADLRALAATIVSTFDTFRAPPSEDELHRRRKAKLSPAQEANLMRWGYPHVMDQFRFHMTLTGRSKDLDAVAQAAQVYFEPVLPTPFAVDHLTLAGQRGDGMFQEITRLPLKS